MRVLVVKTSSLGDIIHTLPALTDAARITPSIEFDWVIEEAFQEIPSWHPAVRKVIPVALRRWRKQKGLFFQIKEIRAFLKNLRQEKYDYVIDAQGLLKSACITFFARKTASIGLSSRSARDPFACLFYQKRVRIPWGEHAITRIRNLFSNALGYNMPLAKASYGIDEKRLGAIPEPSLKAPYYVFLHGTTWENKHWPESYWIELAQLVAKTNGEICLLWGNEEERSRADRIKKAVKEAFVVPTKLCLGEVAAVLAGAEGIVSVDTGLGHLAAALDVPMVSLYGPTDPKQSGTWGKRQISLAAAFPCAPCMQRKCTYTAKAITVHPPCFESLSPSKVFEQLMLQKEVPV